MQIPGLRQPEFPEVFLNKRSPDGLAVIGTWKLARSGFFWVGGHDPDSWRAAA
jgi:hypothetical protein